MTRSNIKTKDGRISAYGFACGYVEAVENGSKRATILMEHGVYHVQWTVVAEYRRGTLLSENTR